MTTGDIRQCEETTHHAQLGETGRCWCGFKKYPIKKEQPVPRCPFCDTAPEVVTDGGIPIEAFCGTEGCAAFSNIVNIEKWKQRAPHELAVMHIPSDEPIFVLRAQDAFALMCVYTWIDLAEKKKVNEAKIDSALADAAAMQAWQDKNGNKIPD